MAFNKKFLDSLGLSGDTADKILEAHTAAVDILKAQADNAAQLKCQLDIANEKLSAISADDYKGKYETLKEQITAEKTANARASAYTDALRKAGIPEKRIPAVLKVTDLGSVEFDSGNSITDEAGVIEKIRLEYGGLIPAVEITGASPETPPSGTESSGGRTGIAAQLQKQYQESMYGC